MRKLALLLTVTSAALVPPSAAAQEEESAAAGHSEIGVLVGLTSISGAGDLTVIGLPGAFTGFGGPLYFSAPVADRVAVRVEGSFLAISESSETLTALGLGAYGSVGFGGFYLLAGPSLLSVEEESEFAVGGGAGYASRVGQGLVLRLEGRYNKYLSEGFGSTIQLFVGIGAVIG